MLIGAVNMNLLALELITLAGVPVLPQVQAEPLIARLRVVHEAAEKVLPIGFDDKGSHNVTYKHAVNDHGFYPWVMGRVYQAALEVKTCLL
jgi:hypothetical protein